LIFVLTPATLALAMSAQVVLRALAEPRRPAILRLVRDEARSVGEIAAHFDITQQAVSQHLQVLRDAGLVDVRREGTKRLYRVRPEGLLPLREFLEELWDDRLDALRREAEHEERSRHADDER
jgi:DNA-binding transcriptional ArsR family regulator